jgi:hypothetical protein
MRASIKTIDSLAPPGERVRVRRYNNFSVLCN